MTKEQLSEDCGHGYNIALCPNCSKEQPVSWEEEFDRISKIWLVTNELAAKYPILREGELLWHPDNIKEFIRETISQQRKEEREKVIRFIRSRPYTTHQDFLDTLQAALTEPS